MTQRVYIAALIGGMFFGSNVSAFHIGISVNQMNQVEAERSAELTGGEVFWGGLENSAPSDFNSTNPLAAPADGSQLLFVQESSPSSTFAQRSVAIIAANNIYTLTVAVGVRHAALEPTGDWSLQLWAGASGPATLLGETSRGGPGAVHPGSGGWVDNRVVFDSAALPSVVGQNLYVVLKNFTGSNPGTVFFDNVRLDTRAATIVFQDSFETPVVSGGGVLDLDPNYGWTRVSSGGDLVDVWYPNDTSRDFYSVDPLANPAGGNQILFIQDSAPNTSAQRSAGIIAANNSYTLTVAIGARQAVAEPTGDWSLQLWAGVSGPATLLGETVRGGPGAVHPGSGGWADNRVVFDSAALPSVVGQNLYVVLKNSSGGNPGTVFFDNVRLTVTPDAATIVFQDGFEAPALTVGNILAADPSYGWTLVYGGGGAYVWHPVSSGMTDDLWRYVKGNIGAWVVSEDGRIGAGVPPNIEYNSMLRVFGYCHRSVGYHEQTVDPLETLTIAEAQTFAGTVGGFCMPLARTWLGVRGNLLKQHLDQGYCNGITFEQEANSSILSAQSIRTGIKYAWSTKGKDAYMLLPPRKPATASYLSDVQGAVNYLTKFGSLDSPKATIVLATYERVNSGVAFLDGNSLKAAYNWLKTHPGHR